MIVKFFIFLMQSDGVLLQQKSTANTDGMLPANMNITSLLEIGITICFAEDTLKKVPSSFIIPSNWAHSDNFFPKLLLISVNNFELLIDKFMLLLKSIE